MAPVAEEPNHRNGPAQWMAATCFLTTLVFPILYMPLIDGHPFAAFVLLARNAMVVGLFVWAVVALWRAGSATAPRAARSGRPRGRAAQKPACPTGTR